MKLTKVLLDNRTATSKRFMDSLRLLVKGGTGGHGLAKYNGIGGKGGDVWVQAEPATDVSQSLKRLYSRNPSLEYVGHPGGDSAKMAIQGSSAPSVTIDVPLGVTCVDEKTMTVIGEINTRKDKFCLAKGGEGGNSKNQYRPQRGEARYVLLEMKMLADIGLVGFPNAVTTIKPELGVVEYDDFRMITMADLPGLIEGAHKNHGLGHRFLRHVERTRLLMFVIDINGFRLSPSYPHRTAFETIVLLNKELELYKESLTDKQAILVVNKMDSPGSEKTYEELADLLRNYNEVVNDLDPSVRPEYPVEFDDVIPISGLKHYNVDLVKERVRELIDYHDDLQKEREKELKDGNRRLLPQDVLPRREYAKGYV